MFALRLTVKPLACSASWYRSPIRFSSEKFLSPTVIVGLPWPGVPAGKPATAPEARADPVWALAGELVLPLLPQAATARVSAARPASAEMRPQEPGNRDAGFRVLVRYDIGDSFPFSLEAQSEDPAG